MRVSRIFENQRDCIIYISSSRTTNILLSCPLFLRIHQENACRSSNRVAYADWNVSPFFFQIRKVTGDLPTRDDTATAFRIFRMSLHNIRIEDRVKRSYTLYNWQFYLPLATSLYQFLPRKLANLLRTGSISCPLVAPTVFCLLTFL